MNPLNLTHILELQEKEIIAAYGGGGKTTLLYRLAGELAQAGQKVLFTTTTKIFRPETIPVVLSASLEEALFKLEQYFKHNNIVTLAASVLDNGKLVGIETSWLEKIVENSAARYILVEADGAAHKPIKGHASFEPVLPPNTGLLLPVLGLDALGLRLDPRDVHRPELLGKVIGARPGEQINLVHIKRYLQYLCKIGRETVPRARLVPVINKMDLLTDLQPVKEIAGSLQGCPDVERILFTTLQADHPVKFVFDAARTAPFISAVILAAGCSQRMGKDKLRLQLKEKTLLEHSVENALGSKVGEVIVVTRPESLAWVKKLFSAQAIKAAINPFYQQGIATSLQAGLQVLHPLSQGVVFALGDQPFITAAVYNALLESHARQLPLVACPIFNGKRGNPVLFDRRTWPLLGELKGDKGGRQIFALLGEKEILNVQTSCAGILQDIDTPEDYRDLLPPH